VKSKARADQWNEEVELVQEEMWHVLTFLEWKAVWWTEEGNRDLRVRPDIADGVRAYAAKQAYINRALACSFKMRWESAPETQGQDHEQDYKQDKNDLTNGSEYTRGVDEYVANIDTDVD